MGRTWTDVGFLGQRMETCVTTPRVPSAPMKSCLTSNPVLSFRRPESESSTVPSASTASTPRTEPWRDPYLIRRSPPALVLTFPPIWQLPLAPRSRGMMKPSFDSPSSSCSKASGARHRGVCGGERAPYRLEDAASFAHQNTGLRAEGHNLVHERQRKDNLIKDGDAAPHKPRVSPLSRSVGLSDGNRAVAAAQFAGFS